MGMPPRMRAMKHFDMKKKQKQTAAMKAKKKKTTAVTAMKREKDTTVMRVRDRKACESGFKKTNALRSQKRAQARYSKLLTQGMVKEIGTQMGTSCSTIAVQYDYPNALKAIAMYRGMNLSDA